MNDRKFTYLKHNICTFLKHMKNMKWLGMNLIYANLMYAKYNVCLLQNMDEKNQRRPK